jgi:hypothetical protein
MDNAIRIGNEISKESSDNLKNLIETIFTVGASSRMEQETIKKALEVVASVTEVKNVTITNSTFRGDNHVHMDGEEPTN